MATRDQFIKHALRNGKTEADGEREFQAQQKEIGRRKRYKNSRKKWHHTCQHQP